MDEESERAAATKQVHEPVDRWPNRRIIFLAVVVALIFYAIFRLPANVSYVLDRARSTLVLLILSVALAYFLLPLVDTLMRLPWPKSESTRRMLASLLAIFVFTVALVALVAVVVTPLAEQLGILLREVSNWASQDLAQQLNEFFDQLLTSLPEPYRSQAADQLEQLRSQLRGDTLAETLGARITEWGGAILQWHLNLLSTVLTSGGYLFALLIVPVFAYYFLTDATAIRRGVAMHVPREARQRYHRMVHDMDRVIQGYVHTVMVISLITGVATALTLYFTGVPVWLTFGILAGVANMVPVVGGIVAVVMIGGISLLTVSIGKTAIILLVYGAIQMVTDRIIAPKLMGEGAQLHPVAVIIALLVGAEFLGMIGVLIAVPMLAVLRVAWVHYWAYISDEGHARELEELLGRPRPERCDGEEPPPEQPRRQTLEVETEAADDEANVAAEDGDETDDDGG